MLFGTCTLVMDVFKTGYYSSFFECQSAINILYPLIQAVFVILQVGRKVALRARAQETWAMKLGTGLAWAPGNCKHGSRFYAVIQM